MRSMGDIRQMAGWLEGEGCFDVCGGSRPQRTPRLRASTTDADIARWAKDVLGMNAGVHGPYQTRCKPVWQMQITGPAAAGWMMTLFPFLGLRRREQIKRVLVQWHLPHKKFVKRKLTDPSPAARSAVPRSAGRSRGVPG
jgi:hypothetical protein